MFKELLKSLSARFACKPSLLITKLFYTTDRNGFDTFLNSLEDAHKL